MENNEGDLEVLVQTPSKAVLESETIAESAPKPEETPVAPVADVADVPDPDEDDLDDLDEMLEEFSPSKAEVKNDIPTSSGPGRPAVAKIDDELSTEGVTDDDFANQLQAGMADLLGGLGSDPEMQAQFEEMMKGLAGAGGLGDLAALAGAPEAKPKSAATSSKASQGEESFQETIKKTMERMQASGESATAAATAADDSDDILAELMKQMQTGGLDGEGSEEDFSKMLMGMMEQLTNKEILYEPMKELDDKFPSWMEKNKATTPKEDLERYKEQQTIVAEIVAKFEEKSYTDASATDRDYIVERMQKMQAAGSPPADLVGDMAAATEAFGAPEEGCPQQ